MSPWGVVVGSVIIAFSLVGFVGATDPLQEQTQFQEQMEEYQRAKIHQDGGVYGWQLMSEQERSRYREQLMQLKTEKERERFRYRHQEQMRERVDEQGRSKVFNPDQRSQRESTTGDNAGAGRGKK